MFYVYSQHLSSGKQDFVGVFETAKEAVKKIALCFEIDKSLGAAGEYYYFMKKH